MKVRKSELPSWLGEHQVLGRIYAFFIILLYPIVITLVLWFWHWKDVKSNFKNAVEVALGEWEDG